MPRPAHTFVGPVGQGSYIAGVLYLRVATHITSFMNRINILKFLLKLWGPYGLWLHKSFDPIVCYALPTATKLTNAFLLMKHIFPLFKPDKCLLSWEFPDYCLASSDWLSLIFPWSKTFKMTTLLFQITFAPHGLEEKLGIVFFNIKSRSHNEISGFLKISSYKMCAIGITYFRKLDNSEHQLFPV